MSDNKLDDVDDNNDTCITDNVNIPILPLRDAVVFPNMVIPLFVGREKSIVALDRAMKKDKKILLLTQKTADIDEPSIKDLFTIGTLSTILQLLKLPDGTVKVLVEGNERAIAKNLSMTSHFQAEFDLLQDDLKCDEKETHVLVRSINSLFEEYVKINKKIPPEILTSLSLYFTFRTIVPSAALTKSGKFALSLSFLYWSMVIFFLFRYFLLP